MTAQNQTTNQTTQQAQTPAISQSELDELYSQLIYAYVGLENTAHAMHRTLKSKCSFRHLSMEYQTLIGRLNHNIQDKLLPVIKDLSRYSDNDPMAGNYERSPFVHSSDDDNNSITDDDYPY